MRPRVLEEAEAELLAAMLWYEERQVGLGEAFYERVTETMQAIAKDPFRFPLYEGLPLEREFRRAPVPRFPYTVVFEVRNDETVVLAVAHSGRQPGYWRDR